MEATQTRTDKYKCGICHRNFFSLSCFQLHEKTHDNLVQKCEECGAQFSCFPELYQHVAIHISGETSPRTTANEETRRSSLVTVEEAEQLTNKCDREVKGENSGNNVMLDFTDRSQEVLQTDPHTEDCSTEDPSTEDPNREDPNTTRTDSGPGDEQADTNLNQGNHNQQEKSDDPVSKSSDCTRTISCHLCHKTFNSKTVLTLHLRKHKKRTPYKCRICGLGFISWNAYKLHKKSYGNTPHKKRNVYKTAEKKSSGPVGYCSKMFPQSTATLETSRSTVTCTPLTDADINNNKVKNSFDSTSIINKYSGWFVCLICGAKVRGRKGSLFHHNLFHVGHELSIAKSSRFSGLRRPRRLKCLKCDKNMRTKKDLELHEARCDMGGTSSVKSAMEGVLPGYASLGRSVNVRNRYDIYDSIQGKFQHLSHKHGLTGPWRKCALCFQRCRGWHNFHKHLETMHGDVYRSVSTSTLASTNIQDASPARPGIFKQMFSFAKCTNNMQCSWYSCPTCGKKLQGRRRMKYHHAMCSQMAEVPGTQSNTALKGTMLPSRKTASWYKASQKTNCSIYRCTFCNTSFKGRRRVVEHVKQCSKKEGYFGTLPARNEDPNSQNSFAGTHSQSEVRRQRQALGNLDQTVLGTWKMGAKCSKACKGLIGLCAHAEIGLTSGAESTSHAPPSNFWKYGCWYRCRSCKEKCRGNKGMTGHVCPPMSRFEKYKPGWYRCRACRRRCRGHQGMRGHACHSVSYSEMVEKLPEPSTGSKLCITADPALSSSTKHSSHRSGGQLQGYTKNGSWYTCNVCEQKYMGITRFEEHSHYKEVGDEEMTDFSKNGTWYWCRVCKMRLRGEKALKSHVHSDLTSTRRDEGGKNAFKSHVRRSFTSKRVYNGGEASISHVRAGLMSPRRDEGPWVIVDRHGSVEGKTRDKQSSNELDEDIKEASAEPVSRRGFDDHQDSKSFSRGSFDDHRDPKPFSRGSFDNQHDSKPFSRGSSSFDEQHDSNPRSADEKGDNYFGWTVITEFSDEIHLNEEPDGDGRE